MPVKKPKIVSRETLLPVTVERFIMQMQATVDDFPDDDEEGRAQLAELLQTATEWVEVYTGVTIVGTIFEFSLDRFPFARECISLAVNPVVGEQVNMDLSDLDVDDCTSELTIAHKQGWPITQRKFNAVKIRVKAGHVYAEAGGGEDNNSTPKSLCIAILLLATHYWNNRSASAPLDIKQIEMGLKAHCDPCRLHWI